MGEREKSEPFNIPECRGCAACCYVFDVVVGEQENIPAHLLEPLPRFQFNEYGHVCKHKLKHVVTNGVAHCAALDPKTNTCTIYKQRPRVCRDFQPGCSLCITSILMHRDKTDRSLATLKGWELKPTKQPRYRISSKVEYRSGHRRWYVDDRWTDWKCFGCGAAAKRICHIKHTHEMCKLSGEEKAWLEAKPSLVSGN